jgi:hypothetical protein
LAQRKETKENIGFKLFAKNSALRVAYPLIQVWEIIAPDRIGIVFPHSPSQDYLKAIQR